MKLKKVLKYLKFRIKGKKIEDISQYKSLKYINITRARKTITRRRTSVLWEKDALVAKDVKRLIASSGLPHNIDDITVMRSYDSKARAYARIWGLSKIWQLAIEHKPHYIIEVLTEKYDKLSRDKKDEVLLHELAHIPNNFSGSLIPHIRRGKRNFKSKVDKLIRQARINSKK